MKALSTIVRKTAKLLSLLFAISLLSFLLMSASPIDPVQAYVGTETYVSAEQRAQIEAYWGLNEPPHMRYLHWLNALLHGDFGISMIYRRPVLAVIGEKFTASLALMGFAWVFSGLLGFGLGLLSGSLRGSPADRAIKFVCLTLSSTPTFWLALVAIVVFSVKLGWFPVALGVPAGLAAQDVTLGARLHHLILPALTLSVAGVPNIALHTRSKLIDILESDYVLYARSRGKSRLSVLRQHGIRNIMLPAITLQFAAFSELFGGSVLTEQVFSYPGLGAATVQAGLRGDMPLLLGIALFSAIFVFSGNLTANILYGIVDPRIREGALHA